MLKISDYIKTKTKLTTKEIYKELKALKLVDYSYTNFSAKMRNNTINADELLYISCIINLDLNKIKRLVNKNLIKKRGEKMGKTILIEKIEEILKKLEKENVIAKYESPKIKKIDNYIVCWEGTKGLLFELYDNEETAVLLSQEHSLDHIFDENNLKFKKLKEQASLNSFAKLIKLVMLKEVDNLKALGLYSEHEQVEEKIN